MYVCCWYFFPSSEADTQVQVHMTIDGPVVLDIVQHFIERWNEVKHRKVSNFIHPELP